MTSQHRNRAGIGMVINRDLGVCTEAVSARTYNETFAHVLSFAFVACGVQI